MADDRSEEGRVRLPARPHLQLETHGTERAGRETCPLIRGRRGGGSAAPCGAAVWGPTPPHPSPSPLLPNSAPRGAHLAVWQIQRHAVGVCTQTWP